MKLFIKKLRDTAIMPTRATDGSAGFDLSACIDADCTILPHQTAKIPTGIAVAPQTNAVVLLIYARSGLATRYGIALANGVGVVDSDYRGELLVALINQSDTPFVIHPGMRIAQLVAAPVLLPELSVTETLPETTRSTGGFGSTGI